MVIMISMREIIHHSVTNTGNIGFSDKFDIISKYPYFITANNVINDNTIWFKDNAGVSLYPFNLYLQAGKLYATEFDRQLPANVIGKAKNEAVLVSTQECGSEQANPVLTGGPFVVLDEVGSQIKQTIYLSNNLNMNGLPINAWHFFELSAGTVKKEIDPELSSAITTDN